MFGAGILAFSTAVSAGDGIKTEAIQAAADAGAIMVELGNAVPNTGGLLGMLVGNNDLGNFGENIASFGSSIAEFSNTVTSAGSENVSKSIDAAESLGTLATTWVDMDTSGIDKFDRITDISDALKTYSDDMKTTTAITFQIRLQH